MTIYVETSSFKCFLERCKDVENFRVYAPKSFEVNDDIIFTSNGEVVKQDDDDIEKSHFGQSALDGLVVFPGINKNHFETADKMLYLHSDSPKIEFDKDQLACELELHNEIFDALKKDDDGDEDDNQKNANRFLSSNFGIKVYCAKCLLDLEPNGIVCIISPSKVAIIHIIELAKERKRRKLANGVTLSESHAEYLCFITVGMMKSLDYLKQKHKKEGTNFMKDNFAYKLKHLFREQGVEFDRRIPIDFNMTFHLRSISRMFKSKENNKSFMMITLTQNLKEDKVIWEISLSGKFIFTIQSRSFHT